MDWTDHVWAEVGGDGLCDGSHGNGIIRCGARQRVGGYMLTLGRRWTSL